MIEEILVGCKMTEYEHILEHNTRRIIYNYIISHPGIPFTTIEQIFELTKGTLRYHLHVLEKNNKIISKIINHSKCFYSQLKMEFERDILTINGSWNMDFEVTTNKVGNMIITNYPNSNLT